jgi:hypothetical protein
LLWFYTCTQCTLSMFILPLCFHSTFLPSPLFQTVIGGSHYVVFMCIYVANLDSLCHSVSFTFYLLLLLISLDTSPYFQVLLLLLLLSLSSNFWSSFHKWARTCTIWIFELGLSCSAWWTRVPSIFLQMTYFHIYI